MLITKREEVTKQGFCKILWRKLRPRGSLSLEFIHSSGWGGGERLYEFDWEEEEGVSAYSRWALIWGWALIRINTEIFLKVSWKMARVRKRKTNCAIITSFPFSLLLNSSCLTSFPWSHPCVCSLIDHGQRPITARLASSIFYKLSTKQRAARKHLVIVKWPLWPVGKERPYTANKQV